MEEEKRREVLSKHRYAIFQANDSRWKTTIPDKTKKSGRRLIAKSSKRALEDYLIEYYEQIRDCDEQLVESLNDNPSDDVESGKEAIEPEKVTLEKLYPVWLESRMLEANNVRTVKRNDQDWRRYYQDTAITKIPMKQLTSNQLKDWAHRMIADRELDKKSYYNMTVIIKKCFEYAAEEGICENTWSKVKINTKKFKKRVKPDNETQIYFADEREAITRKCFENFIARPWFIGVLSIPLLFCTGMRVGELVALKYEDVKEKTILIKREEVGDFFFDDKKRNFRYLGKKVEDHAKTEAGIRSIPLTDTARKIIELVKEASIRYGYECEGYIFCPRSQRLTSNSVDCLLYRYCEELGIPKKSAHKIRKTYISKLISSGIDLDTVCRVAGHVDAKTTFDSYLFCLDRKEETYKKFEMIFQEKPVPC